jgi:ankyrin repeat protein
MLSKGRPSSAHRDKGSCRASIAAKALLNACPAGDAAAVSSLLPAGGARLHLSGTRFQCPNDKSSPLMVTATHGHADIVRMILARAPNTAVDYVGASGGTALVATAQYHHANILRLLAS